MLSLEQLEQLLKQASEVLVAANASVRLLEALIAARIAHGV